MNPPSRRARVTAAGLSAIVLAVLFVPLFASSAAACGCVGLTEAESLDLADVAFTGRVESVTDPRSGLVGSMFGDGAVTATLVVDQVYKGSAQVVTEVTTAMDGAACGFAFEVDRDYAVFASLGGDGVVDVGPDDLTVNRCRGTRLLGGVPPDGVGASPLSGGSPPGASLARAGLLAGWLALAATATLAVSTLTFWARLGRTFSPARRA